MIVGIKGESYPSKRMIIGCVDGCEYVQLKSELSIYNFALRALKKIYKQLEFKDLYAKRIMFRINPRIESHIDIIHTFNRICTKKIPWVTTFEKTMPEYCCKDNDVRDSFIINECQYIVDDSCKAIIAMSKWAYNYELNLLREKLCKEDFEIIRKKMFMEYPPQRVFSSIANIEKKYTGIENRKLTFIYVGSQMKRKGGYILVKVLERLSKHYSFNAIIIGDPLQGFNNYKLTISEQRTINDIIGRANWIQYYKTITNDKVLELMMQSDVGVLPTIGDTFGFSVLEMQACGCPVITTNREALPEINNESTGWIINTNNIDIVSGDDYGKYSKHEIELISNSIEHQLEIIIKNILQNPQSIKDKAVNSLNKIRRDNSPFSYQLKIQKIYNMSVNS